MHNIPPVCATWISPGPGIFSALILRRRERPFIRPLRKREILCVLIRQRREGCKKKESALIFIFIILKGAQIGFIRAAMDCDRGETMADASSHLTGMMYTFLYYTVNKKYESVLFNFFFSNEDKESFQSSLVLILSVVFFSFNFPLLLDPWELWYLSYFCGWPCLKHTQLR